MGRRGRTIHATAPRSPAQVSRAVLLQALRKKLPDASSRLVPRIADEAVGWIFRLRSADSRPKLGEVKSELDVWLAKSKARKTYFLIAHVFLGRPQAKTEGLPELLETRPKEVMRILIAIERRERRPHSQSCH